MQFFFSFATKLNEFSRGYKENNYIMPIIILIIYLSYNISFNNSLFITSIILGLKFFFFRMVIIYFVHPHHNTRQF